MPKRLISTRRPTADEDDYGGVMRIDLTDDVQDVLDRAEAAVRHHLDVAGPRQPAPAPAAAQT